MLLAVLPATAPRKPRCRSMLLRWRTPRLRVIDQRHCRAQRSTANVICMQIAICARSPSGPEHQPPTRHWHYPHSARTLSSGFVQSGFYEVALIPALLPSPYHATSQNPQDSRIPSFGFCYCLLQRVDGSLADFCNTIGQYETKCAAVKRRYSITSSASCRSRTGTSKPSALAVLRLITNSNLVGSITGRSAGFAPLRMRAA